MAVTIEQLAIAVAQAPSEIQPVGRKRGRLAVVGLGLGEASMMVPAVRREIDQAQDILGYETYVKMAGPCAPTRSCMRRITVRNSRARHGFELAASGRSVAIVSSGGSRNLCDGRGRLEALDDAETPDWHGVDLVILPGVSAAMAAAARIGAPLGHDFCLISLSDNLKPWAIILDRLRHAAEADFAMAFYNPISKARPWQLGEAIDLLRHFRMRRKRSWCWVAMSAGRPSASPRSACGISRLRWSTAARS